MLTFLYFVIRIFQIGELFYSFNSALRLLSLAVSWVAGFALSLQDPHRSRKRRTASFRLLFVVPSFKAMDLQRQQRLLPLC